MEKLFEAAMFQTAFSYTAAIVVNICLCHDLIYCLRDPMRNPEGRYSVYSAVILVSAFITGSIRVGSDKVYLYGYIIEAIFCVYLIFAIYSIYFAFRFVSKPGISSEARKLIVRVHVVYIFVNVVCQMYNILSRMMQARSNFNADEYDFSAWYWSVMECAFFGQGLWLTIVRLSEPLYAKTIWYNIKKRVCCDRPK